MEFRLELRKRLLFCIPFCIDFYEFVSGAEALNWIQSQNKDEF